jgi:hypothetical protein
MLGQNAAFGAYIAQSWTITLTESWSQLAIKSNNLGSIKCLLEAGADPNMGDDERMLLPFLPSFRYVR